MGNMLVTGATGFVGPHLVRGLLAAGHRVTACVIPGADLSGLEGLAVDCFTHRGELDELRRQLGDGGFDGVLHLATCYVADHTAADLDRLVDANLRFGLQLLQAASEAKVPWMINVGTFWQHYHSEGYCPANLYAATKQAFEDLARYYLETTATAVVTLKLSDTYGPGDTRRKIFHLWQTIAASGESLPMSPGEQEIDVVHIRDVVRAFLMLVDHLGDAAWRRAMNGESFAVSSGSTRTLRELAAIFEQATGRRLRIDWGGRPYRAREVMRSWRGGRPVPGWSPQVDLVDGVRELFA